MMKRVRFAPSPTGFLHIGNARAAVLNWLFAKKNKAEFLLRMDDTDTERSRPEYAAQIHADLAWLGIVPDLMAKQSDRFDRYAEAIEQLKHMGRLYPCFETPEELDMKRKRQLAKGLPPLYDRSALELTEEERSALMAKGTAPHWRFRLEDEAIMWTDSLRGPVAFQGKNLSDPVLVKTDGRPVYTLASVVDDMDFHITDIIRGEDHVTNSAVQLQIFKALGADLSRITLAHFSLMSDPSGQGFSKREGSLSLRTLQEQGMDAMTIFSLIARLGTSSDVLPEWDMDALVADFDFSKFSRSSPKFDPADLAKLNQSLLQSLPYGQVLARLPEAEKARMSPPFWAAICGNIRTLADIPLWHGIVYQAPLPLSAKPDETVLRAAIDALPAATSFDEGTWQHWTKAIQAATNLKGRSLYMPLRQALTGVDHGPEMRLLLPLIGREATLARLRQAL